MILAGTQSKQSGAARALQRIYLKNPRWGSTTDFSSELCANIARQSLRKTLVPVLNALLILLTCDYLSSFQPIFVKTGLNGNYTPACSAKGSALAPRLPLSVL